MLDIVGIPEGELFTSGVSDADELESVFNLLQDLFCTRVKVTVIESETFVLGDWYTTFRKFLDVSFLLLGIGASIFSISTWCHPFKVLDPIVIQ